MKKVPASKVATAIEAPESPLPPPIQEALGELVGAAKEGLLALSVGVGSSATPTSPSSPSPSSAT